ncbi:uncharacterized protein LOC119727709 [Patiria miniata]|uniref:Uncharacterized protein n=1 Tax=Patiria miniata TaxID=46514 RepID=A0A913ZVE8_PATMI|nr:uncharacterized protein LOC119727709 [Patiria miniata]
MIVKMIMLLSILLLLPLPASTSQGTTIMRGMKSEYGFMETARFPDCGVGGYGAFLNTTAYSRGECGIRCLMDDDCLSFEWGEENSTCSLFEYAALPHLRPKMGIVFVDSVDPKVGEQHPCEDDPCLSGNICTEECHPNGYKCQCPDGLQGDFCNDLSPVDGGFSRWGNYSECSDVCRTVSYRNCSDPWVVADGKDCVGPNTRETSCDVQDCNVSPYMGCYEHSTLEADYDVALVTTSSNMEIPLCREVCADSGYKFAALKGQKCYCIRSMQATDAFDESQCSTNCPGDSSQKCGGSAYSSVYSASSSSTGTSYKGCFSGSIQDPKVIQTYSPSAASSPSTTPSTGSATTPEPPSTTPAYPGLTARECMEDCRTYGYLFASLFNETTCNCHNSLEGMDMSYTEGACDIQCPGGDDQGKYCGGSSGYSTFRMDIEDTEFWTEWFNFDAPYSDGHDIETTAEVHDTMPWICTNPLDIDCRRFDDVPYNETGDSFNVACTLDGGGINCTQDLQVYYVNVTFNVSDWRLLEIEESYNATELNCEWIPASTNETMNATMANATMTNATMTNATMTNATMANATMINATMTNATMINATMGNSTLMGTNGTGTSQGYLVCNNQTLVLERNVTVNETFLRLTWRLDRMSPQCQDYKFRLKCKNEPEKMIGCFEAGDVNDTFTAAIGLDIANCSSHCSSLGYPLLGMSSELTRCYCGSSMKNNKAIASQCFYTCGDENYPCGGSGKQSVYYTGDCNLPFGITKSQMSGTLMHNNDATDEYDLWFDALDQNPTIELSNFTNIGVNIPFQLEIDLGRVRSFNRMETKGMYITGMEMMTGATQFRIGYKLDPSHDTELLTDKQTLTAKVFTVSSLSATTSHALGQLLTTRHVIIYVDDYDMFPGFKLEMYGCTDA